MDLDDEIEIGTLSPEGIPVLITKLQDLDMQLARAMFDRVQLVWSKLPEKVRKVTQRHPGYSIRVRNLGSEGYAKSSYVPGGEWYGSGREPSIAVHPMAIFVEKDPGLPRASVLEEILTHELYGHGIGTHTNYSALSQRYLDYVLAPNPWMRVGQIMKGSKTLASFGGRRGITDELACDVKTWVKHQINSRGGGSPNPRWNFQNYLVASSATSLLLSSGQVVGRGWQNPWPTAFGWRTENNVMTCPSTWRRAWLTPGVILPLEVMEEALINAFQESGIQDVSPDEYWRALKGQDQLVRSYSLRNNREALADHLMVGVLGVAEDYKCSRVCDFLERATDIILSEAYQPQCYCGEFISNPNDKYCPECQANSPTSSCGICKKLIHNPFKSWLPDFVGVCEEEWCQKIANGKVAYQQVLSGNKQSDARHYWSLETVRARELEIGDSVVRWLVDGDRLSYVPGGSGLGEQQDLLDVIVDKVEAIDRGEGDVRVVLSKAGRACYIDNDFEVFRSRLPWFELLLPDVTTRGARRLRLLDNRAGV